jgi:hypothetical protein
MSEHWLQHAHGRIVAGDSETEVMADYGWVQITDEEREAIEIAAAELDDEYYGTNCKKELAAAATLRKLLARLHT